MVAYTDNPGVWSLRQEYYYESEVSLNYIGSSWPAWAKECGPVSEKNDIKPVIPSKTTNKQKILLVICVSIHIFFVLGAHAYVGSYDVRMFYLTRNCQVIF